MISRTIFCVEFLWYISIIAPMVDLTSYYWCWKGFLSTLLLERCCWCIYGSFGTTILDGLVVAMTIHFSKTPTLVRKQWKCILVIQIDCSDARYFIWSHDFIHNSKVRKMDCQEQNIKKKDDKGFHWIELTCHIKFTKCGLHLPSYLIEITYRLLSYENSSYNFQL